MDLTRLARNVSTAAVTMIAAWSSWSHMVHVALRFGERPEVAYVLPISVDGMLVVASTAMVEDKRHGRPVRWSARVAFVAGVAASVAANIAAAHPSVGARIVAAWPALAMLLVVEILSRTRTAGPRPAPSADSTDGALPDAPATTAADTASPASTAAADRTPSSDGVRRPRTGQSERPRRTGGTTDIVLRLRAEDPHASPADIAAQVGVSERHVRRVLTSGHLHAGSTPRTVADDRGHRP